MSCASLSRCLLQPLIRPRAVHINSAEPLLFLCPRYSSTPTSRSPAAPSQRSAQDVDLGHSIPKVPAQRVYQRDLSYQEHSSRSSTSMRDSSTAIDPRNGVPDSEPEGTVDHSQTYNDGQLGYEYAVSDNTSIGNAGIDSGPKASKGKRKSERAHVDDGNPFAGLYSTSSKAVRNQRAGIVFQRSHREHHNVVDPPTKPPDFRNADESHVNNVVRGYLSRKSTKTSISSNLRERASWSWDWIKPVQLLLGEIQRTREKLDNTSAEHEDSGLTLQNKDYIGITLSQIPLPSSWTKETFAQYVHDLCRSRMPRTLQRNLGKNDEQQHYRMVKQHLTKQIFIESNNELMSQSVFETALRFYYRFEFKPSVRHLFSYMKSIGFPYSDTCFDIVLRNAASHRDLGNFTALLTGALELGFTPGPKTWTSLVMCLQSDRANDVVFDLMHVHNLITNSDVRQDLAVDILDRKLFAEPFVREDVSTILNTVAPRTGENWFGRKPANVILKYLCMLPEGSDIRDFLKLMTERGCPPSIDSLNILLRRCLRMRDLSNAIELFAEFTEHYKTVPDQLSYDLLFQLAWKKQSTNVCKILWAAACMHSRVSWSMENTIFKSIISKNDKGSPTALWESTAGYLVLDIAPFVHPQKTMLKLATRTKNDATEKEDISTVLTLMGRDMDLHEQFYYSLRSIKLDLRKALQQDQEKGVVAIDNDLLSDRMERLIWPNILKHKAKNKQSAGRVIENMSAESTSTPTPLIRYHVSRDSGDTTKSKVAEHKEEQPLKIRYHVSQDRSKGAESKPKGNTVEVEPGV